eukprot:6183874-Pleurochrysis_carterae.AAC.1
MQRTTAKGSILVAFALYAHASGEAEYTTDMPRTARELVGAFIDTSVGDGVLAGIDLKRVIDAPGVVDVVLAADFKSQ